MDKKIYLLRNALSDLEQIEKSISGNTTIDKPDIISRKLNKFIESLTMIHEEGNSLDETSTLEIPMDIFDFLDNSTENNPELYLLKMADECEQNASQLKEKLMYLDDIKNNINTDIQITENVNINSETS